MSYDPLKPPPASPARPITGSPSQRSEFLSQSPGRASVTARLATPVYGSLVGRGVGIPAARPQHGRNQSQAQQDPVPLAGSSGGSYPGPGTSSISQALKGLGGPSAQSRSELPQGAGTASARHASPDRRLKDTSGSFTPKSYQGQLGQSPRKTEDIEVLRRHLAGPSQAGSEPGSFGAGGYASPRPSGSANLPASDEFSSLQMQGGDTTRHIYRYAEKREREQTQEQGRETGRLKRSKSVTLPKADDEEDDIKSIQVPGGFRRDHLRRSAASPAPAHREQRPQYGSIGRAATAPVKRPPTFPTSNFIEFLTLYGHFAGEQLDEDDEALGPDEYFSSDAYDDATTEAENGNSDDGWGEDSALLPPGKRKRRRKAREAGKGTPFGAALLLLKSFVGTGVLFLPRAFYNGGMLFSLLVLVFLACLSYYCFLLLVGVRAKVPVSYGDMGAQVYGPYFRNLINFSLVISQIGFASAYIVFVSENIQAFVLAVSQCRTNIEIEWVILIQLFLFLPISLYRNINNIQKLALVADLFICLGLLYLYYYDIKTLVQRPGFADFVNFNPSSWTLLIGTAIFTFEGVGLVIPIQSGMRDPEKFPKVLATVTVIMSVLFISIGALSYSAYGSNTKTVILLNMPQDSGLVNGVQFLYSLAILMSIPLQIFPAIEITSQQLFSKTGKYNPWIKWQKNCFRFFMVILCCGVAWAGADDLDKFVSLVGSFACIPLVYIYPPLMHYRILATRLWQKVADFALLGFGVCMMTYTTALTVESWMKGLKDVTPGYCDPR